MFLHHQTIPSDNWFFHLQNLKCNNLQLFGAALVKSRFSLCLGHRTVPKRSNFDLFRLPALLCFPQNVHRDPLAARRAQFSAAVDQQMTEHQLQEFNSGIGPIRRFSSGTSLYVRRPSTPLPRDFYSPNKMDSCS